MGSVFRFKTYKSELGDALFPASDAHNLKLRSYVGELVSHCKMMGYPLDSYGLGKALAEFVPEQIAVMSILSERWAYEKALATWNDIEKPLLTQAIEDHFINGGAERQQACVEAFLSELESVGVSVQGKEILVNALKGNWKVELVRYAVFGRPEGVIFCGKQDHLDLHNLFQKYGFSTDQFEKFIANIRSL
ncbi:hypothetical protein [Enterovibrio norvegicus]|uniref:hypothetical protein n=1 Tax=Enterovibrio norvegicus TaxID=188144 RepID=UPI00352D9162